MPSGGKRAGAGRKAKPKLPRAPSKDLAQQILDFVQQRENPHGKRDGDDICMCLNCQYWDFTRAKDVRFRHMAINQLLNRTLGLPCKTAEEAEMEAGPKVIFKFTRIEGKNVKVTP